MKDRIDEFEQKAKWASAVHEELDGTLNVYESVKSELREKYLAYINEYTNDIFREVYLNSSYQRIAVTEVYNERSDSYDYDIKLLRDDRIAEDPSNASGGERAIVNLALRAGIYKLIAELEGGDRGRLRHSFSMNRRHSSMRATSANSKRCSIASVSGTFRRSS